MQNRRIILLNGPSSSGKSTLAGTLQRWIKEQEKKDYAIASIDDFLKMTAEDVIYEEDVFAISSRLSENVAGLLRQKDGVIIDHVITSGRIYAQLMAWFGPESIVLIRVTCPVEVLRQREMERGNRCPGSAEASAQYLFPQEGYQLTVDTHMLTPDECASRIVDAVF